MIIAFWGAHVTALIYTLLCPSEKIWSTCINFKRLRNTVLVNNLLFCSVIVKITLSQLKNLDILSPFKMFHRKASLFMCN